MSTDNILSHVDEIYLRQKVEQARVFRLAQRDYGLTLKAISLDSGIGYTTIQSYAKGDGTGSVMSIASLFRLVGVIPNDLLSLLLPEGQRIVTVAEEIDHDEISKAMRAYLDEKDRAHHPDSENGRDLGPTETNVLCGKFAEVRRV